jgi:hypothetical protein
MNYFISIVNNFNLVIFTDENSKQYINTNNNPKIQIIIKPMEHFYNYKYKSFWIENHTKNTLLNDKTSWELNMLWAEKIAFVKETIEKKYFQTDFYGWCDIGYFRNRIQDTKIRDLMSWPNTEKINKLNKNKVIYACIDNNETNIDSLIKIINNKNDKGLPVNPIPLSQNSIAGGFFILHKDLINMWFHTFDNKLLTYFSNGYLVKDDQIIITDCVFSDLEHFTLCKETSQAYDNWFMFQRILK